MVTPQSTNIKRLRIYFHILSCFLELYENEIWDDVDEGITSG
jgi:hypothetical protein